ncbi:unannotated protein [freshwater metagenome]|uniref:Unannotated protein n=1 Tax=freshwater metagenome TaxID=449393 RepID=A0A6J6BBQ4_9ZZZZ
MQALTSCLESLVAQFFRLTIRSSIVLFDTFWFDTNKVQAMPQLVTHKLLVELAFVSQHLVLVQQISLPHLPMHRWIQFPWLQSLAKSHLMQLVLMRFKRQISAASPCQLPNTVFLLQIPLKLPAQLLRHFILLVLVAQAQFLSMLRRMLCRS